MTDQEEAFRLVEGLEEVMKQKEEKRGWRKVVRSLCDQADSTCVYGAWQMWWKDADGNWIKPVCYDIPRPNEMKTREKP